MNTEEEEEPPRIDKGKARAVPPYPSEQTPLLRSHSSIHDVVEEYSHPPRRRLWTRLCSVFLATLLFLILLILFIALLAYTYGSRASGISSDILIRRALVLRGPDRIDVLNITQDGALWVQVDGRVGLDIGSALEINPEEEDGFLSETWKSIGRWGVRRLDAVTVSLSPVQVSSQDEHLADITIPALDLRLTANPPSDLSWLQEISVPIRIQPTNDSRALLRFTQESWKNGMLNVQTSVDKVIVAGGHIGERGWRKRIHIERVDISSTVRMRIPSLPGLPPPGHDIPFSSFVSLRSFLIRSASDRLVINATASVYNPLPDHIQAHVPSLPFTIILPSRDSAPVPIAKVSTSPFSLTQPNITLSISGHVLPFTQSTSPLLSSFVSAYLSSHDIPILVSSSLFPALTLPATFPAPHPPPQVLQNVTIKEMKIKPTQDGGMAASGTVFARVVLPRGIHVALDVNRVFPDVLVFDGPVPDGDDVGPEGSKNGSEAEDENVDGNVVYSIPSERPLPDPLPERAFAHIRPDDWLPSTSTPVESPDGKGSTVEVSAKIVDVPLEVLPGRDKEFRNFVGKVIFGSHGAVAGVQGVAAVAVHVRGLPIENGHGGEMELQDLPFQGSMRIGKRSLPSLEEESIPPSHLG